MAKSGRRPMIEALEQGRSYTWRVQDGGDLASMRKAVKHGQTLTLSPIGSPEEIRVGDMVLVKWNNWYIFHLVGEIKERRYLIVNSLGKVNGWVGPAEILGRVTEVVEPEPRPAVPAMLDQLEAAFQGLLEADKGEMEDARRLASIVDDLRWYAERLGPGRWDEMPRSNLWSFEQNLWHLTRKTREGDAPVPDRIRYFIDCGKGCVGLASGILSLFEYGEAEYT